MPRVCADRKESIGAYTMRLHKMEQTPVTKPDRTTNKGRREFPRVLGIGTMGTAAVLTTNVAADHEDESDKRKPRYKETDHVKTYYRVNRYPGRGTK
jgi:hypothetical protein